MAGKAPCETIRVVGPHLIARGVFQALSVASQLNRHLTIIIHVAELPRSYVEDTT